MELNTEGFRALTLHRDGKCSRCGIEISAGTKALWNPNDLVVWCLEHQAEQIVQIEQVSHEVTANAVTSEPVGYNKGKAGGSAKAKGDRLVEAREARVMKRFQKFPKVGKLILALSDEPQSTKAWEAGAEGEIAIGRQLNSLAEKYKFRIIHDRLIPRTKANIDHIAITQSGVFVIDAKNYQGIIQVKDRGGVFSAPDPELWVGRRNCMKLISGMKHQVEIVKEVLSKSNVDVPVVGVLAFYAATWSTYKFMRGQEEIDGVLINSKGIEAIVTRQGALSGEQIEHVARLLATQLKSAV